MTDPPWIDDFAGTSADGLVWCNCGWFEVLRNTSEYEDAEVWGDHAEAEHIPPNWNPGDNACPQS